MGCTFETRLTNERTSSPAAVRNRISTKAPTNSSGEWESQVRIPSASVHANALRRMQSSGTSSRGLLISLQQHYGNRYVSRVVALARESDAGGQVEPEIEKTIETERGGGARMDQATESEMGAAFGADFSKVRVHTDAKADALSKGVSAVAFTTGQDVFFSGGAYQPRTNTGRELLAHELTHVVQQGGANVQGKLSVSNPEDASEKEAEEVSHAFRSARGGEADIQTRCACGGERRETGSCTSRAAKQGDLLSNPGAAVQRQARGDGQNANAAPAPLGPAPPNPSPAPPPGACTTEPPAKDPRAIFDTLCLLSDDLKDDARLNDAFHNNPPLTARDPADSVRKLQQALLDVGEVLPKFGADGAWGPETSAAVFSFQSKNGIPPGGFEAGRKTLLALDANLQQAPPKPPVPPPSQAATLSAQCGSGPQAGTIVVAGTGFPDGRVDLTVDGTAGNSALSAGGNLSGSVPGNLKDGSHVVEANAGATHAAAQFTTPCGGVVPPQPDPDPLVRASALLVMAKYQFMYETQRDATEDAIKDLQPIQKASVPFLEKVLEGAVATYLQFEYGFIEQIIRTALFSENPAGDAKLADNASDKAFDVLEDNVKDGLQDALKEFHDEPSAKLEDHLEPYRRTKLTGLRNQNFKLQKNWIASLSDPKTRGITPSELQMVGDAVEASGAKIYQTQYNQTLQGWAHEIAGGGLQQGSAFVPEPGKQKEVEVSVTFLQGVGDKDAREVPGVLLADIVAGGGSDELSPPEDINNNQQAIKQAHIFGFNETTRKTLALPIAQLKVPLVLRGEPPSGGQVCIGKDEAGQIVDGGSDRKGKVWLADVDKQMGGTGDPDHGRQALFNRDFSGTGLSPDEIKGG
jgi:peptidoglycan hydrolase-like protein with peptidoglycan-binding domain